MKEISYNCSKYNVLCRIRRESILQIRIEWNVPYPAFMLCEKCIKPLKYKILNCEECHNSYKIEYIKYMSRKRKNSKNLCSQCTLNYLSRLRSLNNKNRFSRLSGKEKKYSVMQWGIDHFNIGLEFLNKIEVKWQ